MILFFDLIAFIVALPLLFGCGYLLLLTAFSFRPRRYEKTNDSLRFDIVVPSHNEAAGIAQTVKNLLALDWPQANRRVVVVADNCSDNTAQLARDAGAEVLERFSQTHKGKGYALAHAFERIAGDAVVVVDADTHVTSNLLQAFASRIENGAQACQAYYTVDNVHASWRTTLMTIAFSMFHRVRGRARENLRASVGLKGNGMCFTKALLEKVPHHAFSVVEDLEYGIRLGRAGERVWYVDEAQVRGEMVSGEKASRSQRVRWEAGRKAMMKTHLGPLFREAFEKKNLMLLDLGIDLLVPPLSYLALGSVALGGVGALLSWASDGATWSLQAGILSIAALVTYVMRGWWLSETGPKGLTMLAFAPLYVAWKVTLMVKQRAAPKEWVRTDREAK
jgi:cellulose synthase/poly-beta-1,6-N-acetylglucosamine synthase-like glycosyltransferase